MLKASLLKATNYPFAYPKRQAIPSSGILLSNDDTQVANPIAKDGSYIKNAGKKLEYWSVNDTLIWTSAEIVGGVNARILGEFFFEGDSVFCFMSDSNPNKLKLLKIALSNGAITYGAEFLAQVDESISPSQFFVLNNQLKFHLNHAKKGVFTTRIYDVNTSNATASINSADETRLGLGTVSGVPLLGGALKLSKIETITTGNAYTDGYRSPVILININRKAVNITKTLETPLHPDLPFFRSIHAISRDTVRCIQGEVFHSNHNAQYWTLESVEAWCKNIVKHHLGYEVA